MSGIVGIYCADGRPADMAELRRMAVASKQRAPDGITYWNAGQVAFAHLQFCTTPESVEERQPLSCTTGEGTLVWNGRLDNREELIASLAAKGTRPVDNTDPGLALAAYLLWGDGCVQHLIGDFALAVWDARHRRLWCARDYIGIRPFYYFWNGKKFLFGPEIRTLLAHPSVSLRINEGMAGEYLAHEITNCEETLYADIRRLPSGSMLAIDNAGDLRISRWWNPDLSLLQYRTGEEYAEQFRSLMDESVRARIRSSVRWGVPLSGGLDSSTVAVTAADLLKRSGSQEQVQTFSLACPGEPWDESEYILETAALAGLRTEMFPAMSTDEAYFQEQAAWSREFPDYPNGGPMIIPMFEAAKRHFIGVLLTGIGGNQWLEGWPLQFSDLIRNVVRTGALGEWLRWAKEDWEYESGGPWAAFAARRLLAEAAPARVLQWRRKRRLKRLGIFSNAFLRRTSLADRLYSSGRHDGFQFSSREQEFIFRGATSGREVHILELNDRSIAQSSVELRHPFYDRRFVEFCLRLPREQRNRGSACKWVLREAMRGRLPERVRAKTFQAEFSKLSESVLNAPWAKSRLKSLIPKKEMDWLNADESGVWSAGLEKLPARPVWMLVAMDLWLEDVLSRQSNVTNY